MFFILLALVALGVYLGFMVWKTKGALELIGDETIQVPPEESVKVKPVTFLLLGLDERDKGGSMNTDVIKLISMNPSTTSATVVSVPRDSKIELSGYTVRKANAYYANFYVKAIKEKKSKEDAHAYARAEIKDLFSKFFGVPIDYTAVINFKGFADVVDALGGINVDVEHAMHYVDNADQTNIDLQAGPQTLNGQKALDYVRYRQSNRNTKQSNDFERNQRQSKVIGIIADKLTSLGGVARLDGVIDAVGNNLKVDMPPSEIQNLLSTYYKINSQTIEAIQLEGTWRSPFVELNADVLQKTREVLQAKLDE
ncbi:LytR family transcriptional regulator [Paenibacillaceae bacterium]|nr:LytR family transcriptional regulator [Paenibacillaceae bacterium]